MMSDYEKYIHFKSLTGSKAYGLNNENSDDDWRGFYLPPTSDFFKLTEPPEQIVKLKEEDSTYWELKKYLRLALQNNPNVLETLWSPTMIYQNHVMQRYIEPFILNNRNKFLSKRIMETYGGYATSQLKRGEEYIARGKTKDGWKHLMHLCRLLIQGRDALLTGELRVDVGEYKERLLSIRREEVSMTDFKEWHSELEAKFEQAKLVTQLQDKPEPAFAEEFLVKMRHLMMSPPVMRELQS